MRIDHLLVDPKYKAMIIPLGDYKNTNILDSPIGQVLETIDDPPKYVRVVAKSIITPASDIANSLSVFLYDVPMSVTFKVMRRNWKYDINGDAAIFLVVEEVEWTEEEEL